MRRIKITSPATHQDYNLAIMDMTFQDGENPNEQLDIIELVSIPFGDESHGFPF